MLAKSLRKMASHRLTAVELFCKNSFGFINNKWIAWEKNHVHMFWLWRASNCKWVLLNHLRFGILLQDYLPPFQVHHQAHFWWHWRHFLQKSEKTWLEPLRLLKQPSWCRPKREPNRPSYLDCKYCILAALRKNTSKICLSPFCKFFFNVTSDTKKRTDTDVTFL